VAIKRLVRLDDWSVKTLEYEIEVLKRIHHQFIIDLVTACYDDERRPVAIVMTCMDGGSLEDSYKEKTKFDLKTSMRLLMQAATAITYIHSLEEPLRHGDIKPSNFLLSSKVPDAMNIKLCDFGLTRPANSEPSTGTSRTCSPAFAAPEQLFEDDELSAAIDVYSFAMSMPWFFGTTYDVKPKIRKKYDATEQSKWPTIPQQVPDCIKLIMRRCLLVEPSVRPAMLLIWRELSDFARSVGIRDIG